MKGNGHDGRFNRNAAQLVAVSDRPDSVVRVLLVDYSKAFDLMNDTIPTRLIERLLELKYRHCYFDRWHPLY